MNYFNSILDVVKNYTMQHINSDLEQMKDISSCIDDDYIELKSYKINKSKSYNSFFTENKINKINKFELTNKLDSIHHKIDDINNKLILYTKYRNNIFEKQFIYILKHVGLGLLLSTFIYKIYNFK